MEDISWTHVIQYIETVIDIHHDKFDSEAKDTIRHYLKHDEYEMAFEILWIEILNFPEPIQVNTFEAERIGRFLGLDKDSVLDHAFWSKFEAYTKSS